MAVSMQFSLLDLGLFVFFFNFAGLAVLVAALAVTVCCFLIEITGFARRTILVEVLQKPFVSITVCDESFCEASKVGVQRLFSLVCCG